MMRIILLTLLFAVTVSILLAQTGDEPELGTGEYAEMYLVESWSNLYWISQNSTSWNRSYIQISDIDFADTGIENWDDGKGWTPIGNGTAFTGTYDGQGFSIKKLYINRPSEDNIGLFGHIGHNTAAQTLKRINLKNVEVSGARSVGSLIGLVTGNENTLIENISVHGGVVVGDGNVGGLIGALNSQRTTPGGTDNPVLRYSTANVAVSLSNNSNAGRDGFGGLVGLSRKGTISNCYSAGSVTVTNGSYIGGLVGSLEIRASVINSYSFTVVNVDANTSSVGGLIGGVVGPGNNAGTADDSYWDTEISGLNVSAGDTGVTGNTTDEMLVLFQNWDPIVWTVIEGVSYPYLAWQEPPAETVTPVRPLVPVEPENDGRYTYRRTFYPQQQAKTIVFTANESDNGSASISFVYTTDPSHSSVQLLANPEALSAYYGFTFTPEDVLLEGQTFKLQFPHQPNSIWFRRGGDWQIIPGINTNSPEDPDFSYTISVQDLPNASREVGHQIEFAADRGGTDTLPVELSSFTAIVTADMAVMLEWTAETETNMLGYNIYRSESINLTDAVKANFVIIPAHNTSVALDYSYVDKNVEAGRLYYYWLQSNDLDLTHEFHGPISVLVEQQGETGTILEPEKHTELTGAYPNPFNPATAIRFSITEPANVTISIYNSLGQLMTNLANNRFYTVGNHSLVWDGKDSYGRNAGSGIYFYRMVTDNGFEMTKRMTLLK